MMPDKDALPNAPSGPSVTLGPIICKRPACENRTTIYSRHAPALHTPLSPLT